jgi:hypothetical protein
MGFKWRSDLSKKNKIITNEDIDEIVKVLKFLSDKITGQGDIPPINLYGINNQGEKTKIEVLEKIQIETNYLYENNYCRQYEQTGFESRNSLENTGRFLDKQTTDLSGQYGIVDLSVNSTYCGSEYTGDYSFHNITLCNSNYSDVLSSRTV